MPPRAKLRTMNIALTRRWTQEEFLDWAGQQEARYEFDGLQPVAMTGGSARHSRITNNIHAALRDRLRGSPCSYYGPDLGVRTIGSKVRFPDALVTCTKFPGTDRVAPDVLIAFEVLSLDSERRDRLEKPREYAAVPSIRRYVIVETRFPGLHVLHRLQGDDPWTAATLAHEDVLVLPEINATIAVAEIYEDVEFDGNDAGV